MLAIVLRSRCYISYHVSAVRSRCLASPRSPVTAVLAGASPASHRDMLEDCKRLGSHEQVMRRLGCKDIGELVDPEFLVAFGLETPGQYGMVCRNVRAEKEQLEALGAGPFLYANSKMPNWCEWGEPREVYSELALGYSAGQEIELLGPGRNTTFYSDAIPDDGGPALHHVCVFQDGIAELERQLNAAGYPTAGAGHTGFGGLYTTRFCYVDTRETLGIYLELIEYRLFGRPAPPGEKLITGLAGLQRRILR